MGEEEEKIAFSFKSLKKKAEKVENIIEDIKEEIEIKKVEIEEVVPEPEPITYTCEYCYKDTFTTIRGRDRHEKKCDKNENRIISGSKTTKNQMDFDVFNEKFDNILQELTNIRTFVKIGKLHILTEENLMKQFDKYDTTKTYELKRVFTKATSKQISNMLRKLKGEGFLKCSKDGWYSRTKKNYFKVD